MRPEVPNQLTSFTGGVTAAQELRQARRLDLTPAGTASYGVLKHDEAVDWQQGSSEATGGCLIART